MSVNKKEKEKNNLVYVQIAEKEATQSLGMCAWIHKAMPPPQPKREDRHFLYALEETAEIIQHNPLSHDACKRMPLWML